MNKRTFYEVLFCPTHGKNWKTINFDTWNEVVEFMEKKDLANYQIQRVTTEPIDISKVK